MNRDNYEAAYARLIADASYALLIANVQRLANLLGKAGFRPDQPRVPRGNPDGGQWIDEGGAEEGWLAALQRRLPEPLVLASDNSGLPPKVPDEPPPTTRERNSFGVAVANFLYHATPATSDHEMLVWLYDQANDRIVAYLEPTRALDELYAQGREPKAGYDLHQIVEQGPARGIFDDELIDSPDNVVLIPTYRHWEITAWYSRKNLKYGNMSPRDFLRTESWAYRRKFGLKVLRDFGVLK